MKITLEDDDGRKMSLETALTIIPPGHAVLICPANKDLFLGDSLKFELEVRLQELGIRAVIAQIPVSVWAITDPNARP